jgi:drug/metabolite transporter (DMT)-like permease
LSRRGALLFAAMSVIWGIPYLLIKVAVVEVGPVVLVFLRLAIGAVVLLPFALRSQVLLPALRHWRVVAGYMLVELAVPWLLLSDAELRVSSSLAGLMIAAVPLIGATIAWFTQRERLGRDRLVGLLIGLGGVGALLGLDLAGGADLRAMVELLLVAACYAVGPAIVTRYLADAPALGVNALALSMAALVYLPFAVPRWPDRMPEPKVVAAIAVLGLVCTALAFLGFFALIAEIGPARATVFTYVNPAVAVTLGVALLDEPLTTGILVGFPLVLLGSILATQRTRPAPRHLAPRQRGRSARRAETARIIISR